LTVFCTMNASTPVTAPMNRVSPYLAMVIPVYLPKPSPPPPRSPHRPVSCRASAGLGS
jgi:hypothetical protein